MKLALLLGAALVAGCANSTDRQAPATARGSLAELDGPTGSAVGCAKCSCKLGHCSAGIPAHLSCASVSPTERQRIKDRRTLSEKAIKDALDHKPAYDECNHLVQAIAGAHGYDSFKGKKADQIVEFLSNEDQIEARLQEGWRFVSRDSTEERLTMMGIDEAQQYASVGRLVLAIVHSRMRNEARPPGTGKFENGHVTVMAPAPEGTTRTGWREVEFINAGSNSGAQARRMKGNVVFNRWEYDIVTFWVRDRP